MPFQWLLTNGADATGSIRRRYLQSAMDPFHGVLKGLQTVWIVIHYLALPGRFYGLWDLLKICLALGSIALFALDCYYDSETFLYVDWVSTTAVAIAINAGGRARLKALEYFETSKGRCRSSRGPPNASDSDIVWLAPVGTCSVQV